jgi:hypothetical protein
LFGYSVETGNDGGIDISHLLFANDTLIFCGADPSHLHILRCLILRFKVVSSLNIRLAKSKLATNVEGLARILGCRVSSSLPMKYLGLP